MFNLSNFISFSVNWRDNCFGHKQQFTPYFPSKGKNNDKYFDLIKLSRWKIVRFAVLLLKWKFVEIEYGYHICFAQKQLHFGYTKVKFLIEFDPL